MVGAVGREPHAAGAPGTGAGETPETVMGLPRSHRAGCCPVSSSQGAVVLVGAGVGRGGCHSPLSQPLSRKDGRMFCLSHRLGAVCTRVAGEKVAQREGWCDAVVAIPSSSDPPPPPGWRRSMNGLSILRLFSTGLRMQDRFK